MDRHIKQLPTSSTISNNAWIPYSENGKALKKMTKINMFGDKTLEKPLNYWYENEHLFYRRRVSATPSKEIASKISLNRFVFKGPSTLQNDYCDSVNQMVRVFYFQNYIENATNDTYLMAWVALPKPVDEMPSGSWDGAKVVFASTSSGAGLKWTFRPFVPVFITEDDPYLPDGTVLFWFRGISCPFYRAFGCPEQPGPEDMPRGNYATEYYGYSNNPFGRVVTKPFSNSFTYQGATFYYPNLADDFQVSNPFYGTNPGPDEGHSPIETVSLGVPSINIYYYDIPAVPRWSEGGHTWWDVSPSGEVPSLADDWYQDVDVKIYSTYDDMYADGWASVDELNQYNYGKAVEYMITHEVEIIDISNHYFQLDNDHDNPVFDYPLLYGGNANDAGIELIRFWVNSKGEANFHQMLVNGKPLDIPHSLNVNFAQELTSGTKIATFKIIENGGLPKSIDDVFTPKLEVVDHIQSEAEVATIALGTDVYTISVPKLPAANVTELYSASSYSDNIMLSNVPDVYDMLQIVVCNPDIGTDLDPCDHRFDYMKDELGANVMLELGTYNYNIQVKCLMAFDRIAGLSVQNHTYATPYIRKVYALRYN